MVLQGSEVVYLQLGLEFVLAGFFEEHSAVWHDVSDGSVLELLVGHIGNVNASVQYVFVELLALVFNFEKIWSNILTQVGH